MEQSYPRQIGSLVKARLNSVKEKLKFEPAG